MYQQYPSHGRVLALSNVKVQHVRFNKIRMVLSVLLRIAVVDDAEAASFSGHHLQPDDETSKGTYSVN